MTHRARRTATRKPSLADRRASAKASARKGGTLSVKLARDRASRRSAVADDIKSGKTKGPKKDTKPDPRKAILKRKAPAKRKKAGRRILPIPPPSPPRFAGRSFPRPSGPITGTTSRTATKSAAARAKAPAKKKLDKPTPYQKKVLAKLPSKVTLDALLKSGGMAAVLKRYNLQSKPRSGQQRRTTSKRRR